jgi:two-component system, OmpR family, sensor kinase
MRRLRPRTLRGRLTLVAVLGSAAAIALLVAAFNLLLTGSLDSDADRLLRSRASTEAATLRVRDGRLEPGGATGAGAVGDVWVYSGRTALLRPRSVPAMQDVADELAGGPARFVTVHEATRVYARPVHRTGASPGTVVVALGLAPYHRTSNIALGASLALGLVVLAGVALAARLVFGAALRPVARMTAQATQWSEDAPDRRFAAEPTGDELATLAATFDRLLDRVSAALRHEQRFSAELSHELRTPLARIVAEADLALRRQRPAGEYREALEEVRSSAAQMERTLGTLIALARAATGQPPGVSRAGDGARRAAEACAQAAAEGAVRVVIHDHDGMGALRIGADLDVVERILAPLVENACRYGSSRVDVELGRNEHSARLIVLDDGPGLRRDELDRIFEPGVRGAAGGTHAGAGLGLALARRLARAAGGDVTARAAEGGEFEVTLPLA